jgi:predicted transcriptional regulator
VVEAGKMIGFVTRRDIIAGMHELGMQASVSSIMRKNVSTLKEQDPLNKAQDVMQNSNVKALPVLRGESVIGIVTIEDIMRVYSVMSRRG